MTKIVFDIGGTNTRVAEAENGILKNILKLATPEDKSRWPAHLLEMIKEVSYGEKIESMTGGVRGIGEREKIAGAFPDARVYNDALMAGLGEAVYGAGKDKEVVGYIGLGTGIGTSRISGKKIDSIGFEAGHHIIDFLNNESWEQKISGRILKEKYGKYPQELERQVYQDYVRMIALGVYNAILFWSPDAVVMGGALINEEESFKVDEIADAVRDINEALPPSAGGLPPIRKSELGDNAGLYGAMVTVENEIK